MTPAGPQSDASPRPRGPRQSRVAVLLSAYQGASYIAEQVESIAAQRDVRVELLVRDDGSRDDTPEVLESLRQKHGFRLLCGDNLGVIGSFFELVRQAPTDADYFAFADQDDWWLPDKLSRAVACLESADCAATVPQLYCSAFTIADETLKPLRTVAYGNMRPAFGNALVENIAPGCTMVFNRSARTLLNQSIGVARPIIHDWWLYQVVAGFGQVVYDAESRILYRQHGQNLIGSSASRARQLAGRVQRFFQYRGVKHLRQQALEFQRCYGSALPPEHHALLEEFLAARDGVWHRLRYALATSTFRQRPADSLVLRLLIALGRI